MDFNRSQLPTSVDTVEKLAAWAGLLLQFGNGNLKVVEAENYTDFAAQASVFRANDQTNRLVVRLCLKLRDDFGSNGSKLFLNVDELSEMVIPASYL